MRLVEIATRTGLTITFEDQLMDLALYDGERLLVCVEVKERATQLQELVKKLRTYEGTLDCRSWIAGTTRSGKPSTLSVAGPRTSAG